MSMIQQAVEQAGTLGSLDMITGAHVSAEHMLRSLTNVCELPENAHAILQVLSWKSRPMSTRIVITTPALLGAEDEQCYLQDVFLLARRRHLRACRPQDAYETVLNHPTASFWSGDGVLFVSQPVSCPIDFCFDLLCVKIHKNKLGISTRPTNYGPEDYKKYKVGLNRPVAFVQERRPHLQ